MFYYSYTHAQLSINFTLIGYFIGYCRQVTWLSALSMAQVSEFSFVLCSRARRLRIITREVNQTKYCLRVNKVTFNKIILGSIQTSPYQLYHILVF